MRGTEYREEPGRSALNRVKGMAFRCSLDPYTGCADLAGADTLCGHDSARDDERGP
jgi:hypothetical protein